MPLIEMYFGVGELSDDAKAALSRKVTDVVVRK
jgi:phenylpyruvate tautomerase PptA (4-oxalocrotonate tautomerase family)